jgi:hypothetical protein
MVNISYDLGYENTQARFDSLLNDIISRNQRYPYGNVDRQLTTIKNNLDALQNDPYQLNAYKEQLVPHLEVLDYQLRRLVA